MYGLAMSGLAAGMGGCTVASFDFSRGTSTAATPSAPPLPPTPEPAAEPDTGTYTPPSAHAQQAARATPTPPRQAEAAAPPSTYQPPAQPQRLLPAARAARAPDIPPEPAEPDPEVMTTQRAREQCWMASENTKFARNLDQKVKWVEKCVNDKLRAAGQ